MRSVPIVKKRLGGLSTLPMADLAEARGEPSIHPGSLPVGGRSKIPSGMVGLGPKISVQQLVARGLVPSWRGLDCHENRFDGLEQLRVVHAQNPPFLDLIIHVKDAEILNGIA